MVSAVALLFLPQLPVASSVVLFPVGVEWLVSERDKLLSFLRRKTGKVAVAVGLAHVAFAVYLQSAARAEPVVAPTVLVETALTNPVSGIYSVVFAFLVYIYLFVMVLFPILVWEKKGLILPLAVAAVWVLWGAWSNYLLWDTYPISEFYGYRYLLINIPTPAPDYASKFSLPISLMLLSAVLEMAYREPRKTEGANADGRCTSE